MQRTTWGSGSSKGAWRLDQGYALVKKSAAPGQTAAGSASTWI